MHEYAIELVPQMILAQTAGGEAGGAVPSMGAPAAPAAAPAGGAGGGSTQDLISGTSGAAATGANGSANGLGGNGAAGGGAPASPFGGPNMIFLLMIFMAIVIVPSILGGRREKKKHAALMASLKPGDRVLAAGGLLAQVDKVKDDEVTLKIDENSSVKMKVLRSSIQQILRASDAPAETK